MPKPHEEQQPASGADDLRRGFAAAYPPSRKLDELLRAFHAGNYRRVRPGAERLAQKGKDPEVRRAAKDLRARLEPGRLTTFLFLLPLGLLLVLVAHYLLGTH